MRRSNYRTLASWPLAASLFACGDTSTRRDTGDATNVPDADAVVDGSDDVDDVTVDVDTDAEVLPDLGTAPVEVGPTGGVVHSADGRVRLAFPAGALSASHVVTIEPIDVGALAPLEGLAFHDVAYDLGPDGLTFDAPVEIALTLDAGDVLDANEPGVFPHVYLLHGTASELEILDDGTTTFAGGTCVVRAEIVHFSVFSAANAPVFSQLVAPSPAGDVGQIFNFRHAVGLRRESAAGIAWRPLIQRAYRGSFLELRLPPGVYPPSFPGGFYGRPRWPDGSDVDRTPTEQAGFQSAGALATYISDATYCTRAEATTDTFMSTTVGVLRSDGFTSPTETISTVEYTIDVVCGRSSERQGYFVGRDYVSPPATPPVERIDAPTEPPPPEVDPDEQASVLIGATSADVGALTLDDSGGGFTTIASPAAIARAVVAFIRDGALGIYVLSEGGGQALHTVEREAPSAPIDSVDLGVVDPSEADARRVLHATQNRRPEVAAIGDGRARIIDPHPLFTFGETNLQAAGAIHGPVVAQQYVFYSGPTCPPSAACPASGFAAAVLGHAPRDGASTGRVSFVSTLGHGDDEEVPGSIVGMRCRTPYQCVVVVASGAEGEARQTAMQLDIEPIAAPGENLRLTTLGQLPVYLGDLVDLAAADDAGTFVAAYTSGIAVATGVDLGALELIVDEAPPGCDAVRQIVTSAGEIAVRCDDRVYLRAFGPEAFGRDGCGADVRPGAGPSFGGGLRISAGAEHRAAVDGPAGAVWEVEATFDGEDAAHLSLVVDGAPPSRAVRSADGTWSARALVRSAGPAPGPADADLRVVAAMRPELRAGERCTPYTLTARRLRLDPDAFEPSSPAPGERVPVSFASGAAELSGLTLLEGDVDVFAFGTASDVACDVSLTAPEVPGLASDFGVDFTLIDLRDDGGELLGVARSRVSDVAYTLRCVERAGGAAAEVCAGGVDEDGDGLVDCDDPDCHWEPGCARAREQCSNGIDDDADWRVDCADPDCRDFAGCAGAAVEDCASAADEDADGQAGCNDLDCTFAPGCGLAVEDCGNGADDDGDEDVDCDDEDCAAGCTCFDEEGGPRGDVMVRFGSTLADLARAICIYDTCGAPYASVPIWDAAGFAVGIGLGNPYGGDLRAPYVRPPLALPVDVPVTLASFGSGDMFIEDGAVACEPTAPAGGVDATFAGIEAAAIPPLVVFAGVRSRSASAYLPAAECGAELDEACPEVRHAAFHVYPTDCAPVAGAALVRVVNLSPNQAGVRVTQENELVSAEADVVAELGYGEATPYVAMSDDSGRINRVWRVYDAADGPEDEAFATINGAFDVAGGGDVMEVPAHGTCSTIVITRQRADRFSVPAILVGDAPVLCSPWRNLSTALDPDTAPCE